MAGFVVGLVERGTNSLEPGKVRKGRPAPGNSYLRFTYQRVSLVRKVFNTDEDPSSLFRHYDGLGHQLVKTLLLYHRAYYPMLAPVFDLITGLAHITGGGIPGKVPAVLPDNLAASIDTSAWTPPGIFRLIQQQGGVDQDEMFRVFNMGLGMVAVCPEAHVSTFCQRIPEAIPVGSVIDRDGDEQVVLN